MASGVEQMNAIGYILLSGALGVVGQIILKQSLMAIGRLSLAPGTLVETVLRLALNPTVVLGLAITVCGTFFWLIALSRVDLSYAYPFASLNYLMVLASSWLIFGEHLSPLRLAGVVAICLGVWAISRTPGRTTRETNGSSLDRRSIPADVAPGS
jgi:drug/metabolite transporter (DMT)-like permease